MGTDCWGALFSDLFSFKANFSKGIIKGATFSFSDLFSFKVNFSKGIIKGASFFFSLQAF